MSGVRIGESFQWLESHVNLEAMESGHYRTPTLERITELCGLMGDPQDAFPVIHVTGTNGKGSVVRMVSELLGATGLSVGTYTSPDLEGINERLAFSGEPIAMDEFAQLLSSLALLEPMLSDRPSRFELLTAAAFRWFADLAVDVAVVEVGLGGRWDATNVVSAPVAVVTNVALDHTEILGQTRAEIAAEKSGIVKAGSLLVLGEEDLELHPIFLDAVARVGADVLLAGEQFECVTNDMAFNGRLVDLRVPGGDYEEIFVPLHGAHQGVNAAVALAAVDAFLGGGSGSLSPELVAEGFASVTVPGRMEVVSRSPLVILDGAHNPAGAKCAGMTLSEEFPCAGGRVLLMGLLRGRDPREMIEHLGVEDVRLLVACPAPSPRTHRPEDIVAAARSLGITSTTAASVADGVVVAREAVEPGGLVFVTGSMYVVGAARTELLGPASG